MEDRQLDSSMLVSLAMQKKDKKMDLVLTEKYKKPNSKEHGHTEIYFKGIYLGYIMQNRSKFRRIGENWNFDSKHVGVHCCFASNRQELMLKIKKQVSQITG